MIIAGQVLIILGALVLVIAALGVLRLPDAPTRQHAVALGVLAVALVAGGIACLVFERGWAIRLALLVGAMTIMTPAATNLLARVATVEEDLEDEARNAPTK